MKRKNAVVWAVLLFLCTATGYASPEIPITTTSKEALAQFNKGIDLLDRVRFDDARPFFEKAVDLDPNFALAHCYLAITSTNNDIGIKEITTAARLSTNASEGEQLFIESIKANFEGNTQKQADLLRDALVKYPGDKRAHMTYGMVLSNLQKYDEALRELNMATKIDPKYANAYNILGYTYAYQEKFPEAEAALKTYTELLPEEANPLDSYAEILMLNGKHDASIAEYKKALAINPKFYSSYTGIANNYMFKGMPAEARKYAQKHYDMASADGQRLDALNTMAISYIYEGKFDKATEQLRKSQDLALTMKDDLAAANALEAIGTIALETSMMDPVKGTYLKTATPEKNKVQEARTAWEKSAELVLNSEATPEIKETERQHAIAAQADIALRTGDVATAKAKTEELGAYAEKTKEPFAIWRAHQFRGRIALAEKRFPDAVSELNQTNLRNARNLNFLMQAYEGTGETRKAGEIRAKILKLRNNTMDLAFIRRELSN